MIGPKSKDKKLENYVPISSEEAEQWIKKIGA